MTDRKNKLSAWLYPLAIAAILLLNLVPLAGEYLFTLDGWKSYYLDFHLVDENGRSHSGLLGHGTQPLVDGEIFQYAFETGDEEATSGRKQKVNKGPDADGFHWGDRGYLWAGGLEYMPSREGFEEGKRIGRTIEPWQQSELSGPGAPWDNKGPYLSVLGTYPLYVVKYDSPYFTMHLNYRSRGNGWYLWNGGESFPTGDYGSGNMNELPCDITGTITHKKDNTQYNVTGWGLMEDALGNPWNWFEWGEHNWFSSNYPNGWAVGFWLAPDDWQWGYNVSPHEIWVYDPTRNQYYHGKRVEFLSYEWGYEEINGMKYPKSYRVRGITDAGVVEISARSATFKPIIANVKYVPLDIKMAYSKGLMEGTFTYLNGPTVELTDGRGTMEFFPRYMPDMIYITPWSLALLALIIGGRYISRNRADKEKVKKAVWGIATSWFAIALLILVWI